MSQKGEYFIILDDGSGVPKSPVSISVQDWILRASAIIYETTQLKFDKKKFIDGVKSYNDGNTFIANLITRERFTDATKVIEIMLYEQINRHTQSQCNKEILDNGMNLMPLNKHELTAQQLMPHVINLIRANEQKPTDIMADMIELIQCTISTAITPEYDTIIKAMNDISYVPPRISSYYARVILEDMIRVAYGCMPPDQAQNINILAGNCRNGMRVALSRIVCIGIAQLEFNPLESVTDTGNINSVLNKLISDARNPVIDIPALINNGIEFVCMTTKAVSSYIHIDYLRTVLETYCKVMV